MITINVKVGLDDRCIAYVTDNKLTQIIIKDVLTVGKRQDGIQVTQCLTFDSLDKYKSFIKDCISMLDCLDTIRIDK